jgi:hypothetical protein
MQNKRGKNFMNIYGHLIPGAQKEAAKKLDKLFDDGKSNKKLPDTPVWEFLFN